MAPSFFPIIGVVALRIALCLASDPIVATLEAVNVDSYLVLKVDEAIANAIARQLQQLPKISLAAVIEYAKAFLDVKLSEHNNLDDLEEKTNIVSGKVGNIPDSARSAVIEYAQALVVFKFAELSNSPDLEDKRYNAAQKLADLGFIVFVSARPENYIVVPTILEEVILQYMLIRYVFAEVHAGQLSKDINDAQVKQIIKKENGRIYYKSLEFTSEQPFGKVVQTLGSVHPNEFYMDSDKISQHDQDLQDKIDKIQKSIMEIEEADTTSEDLQRLQEEANELATQFISKKKLPELYNAFLTSGVKPIFDTDLHTENAPWATAVGGIITNISLKIVIEGTKGNLRHTYEIPFVENELKVIDKRLADIVEDATEDACVEYTEVKVKYCFTFTFTWNSYNFTVNAE